METGGNAMVKEKECSHCHNNNGKTFGINVNITKVRVYILYVFNKTIRDTIYRILVL